jgi:hypothetical protein
MATAQEELEESRRQVIGENLTFPKGRLDSVKHKLLMVFYEYSIRVNSNLLTANPSSNMKSLASVTLPVPIKILERYDVEYETLSGSKFLTDLASSLASGLFTAAPAAKNLTDSIMNAASSLASTIGATTGSQINPFNIIQLKGARLRKHNFRWKLHPENKNETNDIEKIINMIRVFMHPKSVGEKFDVILKYPNLINFRIFGAENPDHVFPSAPCVIDSFTVDRTGGDYPSFFAETGTPVVYQIHISVTEILPMINRLGKLDVATISL